MPSERQPRHASHVPHTRNTLIAAHELIKTSCLSPRYECTAMRAEDDIDRERLSSVRLRASSTGITHAHRQSKQAVRKS